MSRNFISVYFLDNSFKTIAIDESMKCEEIAEHVCNEIELTQDAEDFRFFIFNNSQELMLDPSMNPLKYLSGADIRNGVNPLANKLVFKRAFFRGADEEIKCDELKHLMFHQARSYFVSSLWPTNADSAVTLAGLLISVKYGDNNDVDKPGFLAQHYREFFPGIHAAKAKPKVIEPKLIAAHRNNAGLTMKEAEERFYDTIRENCPVFGSIPYPASCVSFGEKKVKGKVFLAITSEGLHIVNAADMSIVSSFQYKRLKSLDAQGTALSIQVLPSEGQGAACPYVFETAYGAQLSTIFRTYVERLSAPAAEKEEEARLPTGEEPAGAEEDEEVEEPSE